MKYLIALALVGSLTACGGSRYLSGGKPGAGQAEFSNDHIECQAMYKRIYPDASGVFNDDFIFQCMQGKGWNVSWKAR